MTTFVRTGVTALVLLAGLLVAGTGEARNPLTADVFSRLVAAMQRNDMLGGVQTRCLDLMLDEETPEYLEVGVYEKHGRGCPGDPNTAPRMATLRYEKQSRRILNLDLAEDEFKSLR